MVAKIKEEKSRRDAMFHIHYNMARIYEMKGLPDEALRLHYYQGDAQGNGLRQEQNVYGAWNLYAIGNCLQLQQDQRAMETHMKALKIRLDLLGDHYYTAISYHKIGQLHLRRHDFTNANEAFREAYRILCNPTENTRAELARTLWYWATVKQEMSQYEDAAKLRQRAVRMRYDLLGQEGPEYSNFTDDDFDKLVVYYNR
jgi:tetratricopeptide (TPR) repeat protein